MCPLFHIFTISYRWFIDFIPFSCQKSIFEYRIIFHGVYMKFNIKAVQRLFIFLHIEKISSFFSKPCSWSLNTTLLLDYFSKMVHGNTFKLIIKQCFLFNCWTVFEIRIIMAPLNTKMRSSTHQYPCTSSPAARACPGSCCSWSVPYPRCPRGRNRGQRSLRRHWPH